MDTSTLRLISNGRARWICGGLALVLIGLSVLLGGTVTASPIPTLDEAALTTRAREEARRVGLRGAPIAQRVAWMTMADWAALNNAELGSDAWRFGLTRDMPVFVLALRGHVEWQESFLSAPGQARPPQYDNVTIALDARTGVPVGVVAKDAGYPMPVPVP